MEDETGIVGVVAETVRKCRKAAGLSQVVSVFRLDHEQVNHVAAPKRTAAIKQHSAPMQPPRAKQALAAPQRKPPANAGALAAGGDWETF